MTAVQDRPSAAVDDAERAQALRRAQTDLAAAVRELCDGSPGGPPLLAALHSATAVSRNSSTGGGGRAFAPVNLGALVAQQQVGRAAQTIHARVLSRSDRDPAAHFRGILAEVGTWSTPEQVEAVAKEVRALAELIISRLQPPTAEVPVAHPCPWCLRRTVMVLDPIEGERVQRPALLLHSEHRTVRCQGCRSVWPAAFAGRLIDQVRREAPTSRAEVEALHRREAMYAAHAQVLAHYRELARWVAIDRMHADQHAVLDYYWYRGEDGRP